MFTDTDKPLAQWTEEVKALTDEIKLYENAILSDEPVPDVTVRCGDWLNYAVRRYNGKTYLFAVNNTFDTQRGNIRIQGIKNNRLVFKPLEVKILSFDQEDVLSSKDDLLSLGFSKGDKVFPMTEGENEKIIYVPEGCNIIDYTANISSDAKLLIGSVESPLEGRITIKNTDTFKVYVVSEDGKKATTHNYRVVRVEDVD